MCQGIQPSVRTLDGVSNLRYPNPTQGYILYTDASGIGWSRVLTQEHLDDKGKAKNHPICYMSGQFRGSQLNWLP